MDDSSMLFWYPVLFANEVVNQVEIEVLNTKKSELTCLLLLFFKICRLLRINNFIGLAR